MEEARLDEEELSEYLRQARGPVAQGVQTLRQAILDPEVKEERTGPQGGQLGYTIGCNLFATLRPADQKLEVDLWVGPEEKAQARAAGWQEHPHPLRAKFGWVHRVLDPEDRPGDLERWVKAARAHAARKDQP